MGSFAPNATAETALIREFGRHVFEIAALSRVSHTLYNLRVWLVGMIWIEPMTPRTFRSHLETFIASELRAVLRRHGDAQV
jgi:hypothetical protein